MEERCRIHLSMIDYMQYTEVDLGKGKSISSDGFSIAFKDGTCISFKLDQDEENIEEARNRWMDFIEEAFYILSASPIPPWVHV